MFQKIDVVENNEATADIPEGATLDKDHWECPACQNSVPYGYAHICPAVTSQEQTIPIYPTQLSFNSLNDKLDDVLELVKKIDKKVK